MRWLSSCVLLVLLAACDRRIAEPEPSSVSGSGETRETPTAHASANVPASAEVPDDRCIHPTPAEPARPAPAAGPAAGCPPDPNERPALRRAEVRFKDGGKRVRVEVAEKDRHRLRGLMYRTALAEDEGMLFVFESRRVHRFWMKNTCLPLDMLFIDRDGLIVGIEENVPTLNEDNYFVPCPSQYVLEVNAGWSRRHGVRAGQYVELPGN